MSSNATLLELAILPELIDDPILLPDFSPERTSRTIRVVQNISAPDECNHLAIHIILVEGIAIFV